MYLLSCPITLAEGRMELSPIMALWPIHMSSQILPSVTPTSKALLIPRPIVSLGGMQTNPKPQPKIETLFSGCVSGFRGAVLVWAHLLGWSWVSWAHDGTGRFQLYRLLFLSVLLSFTKHTGKCRAGSVSDRPALRWYK